MDRTKFYAVEGVVNGQTYETVQEFDFLHNSLSNFVMNYSPAYYTVNETDIFRPDIISFKNYGTVSYWWIICYANEIQDPIEELYIGQLLIIPNVLDLYDFFKKWKVKR